MQDDVQKDPETIPSEPLLVADTNPSIMAVENNIVQPQIQLNPAVPAVSQRPVHASNYIMQQPSSSHKTLIITAVVAFSIVLVGIGGFSYWYFGVRTPDIEYEKASAIIDSMIGDAKGLADAGTVLRNGNTATSTLTSVKLADTQSSTASVLKTIDEAGLKASDYLSSQSILASSIVVTKDANVDVVYSANKKVINEYGTSSDSLYKTAYIYYTLLDRCYSTNSIAPTDTIKTVTDYDARVKLCKDYADGEKTVPIKDFNDSFYVPYRAFLISYIANVRSLYEETTGSKAWNQAYQNIIKASQDLLKIDTSKIKSLTNSQNPQDQLGRLKSKIDERKKIFFR